jgi:hypothetical protein
MKRNLLAFAAATLLVLAAAGCDKDDAGGSGGKDDAGGSGGGATY